MTPDAIDAADILAARERIRGQIAETPLLYSKTLSAIAGCELFIKFENLQFTASFKERGALNRLLALDPEQRQRGVIAVSAGNHAQGIAWHARRLGIPATIVMPRFAPFVKVENTEVLGAEVLLEGESFAQAREHMRSVAAQRGLTVIPPYDDPQVIAGQGTLGIEILEARPDLEMLVLPVGGGGLAAGVAVAARHLAPGIRIVGVQTELFSAAAREFAAIARPDGPLRSPAASPAADPVELSGRPSPAPATIADGIAVETPGALTMPLLRKHLDALVTVSEARLEQAIVTLLEIEKTVVEGAGAAGLAAVLDDPGRFTGKRVGLVLSGGNIDPVTLADVIMRQMVRTRRLARLLVGARDAPGSLARIATILGEQGANIEEVTHQRAFAALPVRYTRIDLAVATRGPAHLARIVGALRTAGFDCEVAGDREA